MDIRKISIIEIRDRFLTKKRWVSFLVSVALLLLCYLIVIFRIFYPLHRWIAIGIYFGSWILYILPFMNQAYRKRFVRSTQVRWLRRHAYPLFIIALFFAMLYGLLVLFPVDRIDLAGSDAKLLGDTTLEDIAFVLPLLHSLDSSVDDLISSGLLDLSMEDTDPQRIAALKSHFEKIVDQMIALEPYVEEYRYFYQISYLEHPDLNIRCFLLAYAPYMAEYKAVLDMSAAVGGNEYVELLLNEEIMSLGRGDVFYDLKRRLAHPDTALRANAGRAYLGYIKARGAGRDIAKLVTYSDASYTHMFGEYKAGIELGIDNILDSFERNTMDRWLPLQKNIANALGSTRITLRHENFITHEQIAALYGVLEPGDIIFERRNWYISNAGMPGFWTHAALYVGTIEQLDEYFARESMDMFGMRLSSVIKDRYPQIYEEKSQLRDFAYLRTIEGKAEGMVMLTLEESGVVDYFAAIRPKLSKKDKLLALLFAFDNHLKPYDYDFDFLTEDAFVCSELVYKAYLPAQGKQGLDYKLSSVAGRWMIVPNDMVRSFDENLGTEKEQNEFVVFLDGDEDKRIARLKDVNEFRGSWKRPKYTFLN